MIVVATEDFELYHAAVTELRDREVPFTTIEPGEGLPEGTRVVLTGSDDDVAAPGAERIVATPEDARGGVAAAMATLRDDDGRTVVGVDPGRDPGIAVLSGDTVVAAFQVPAGEAAETIREAVTDASDPLVRVGDGAPRRGARIVEELDGVPVELVDETGTTPSLGAGARGMSDVLAAVNIARRDGEQIDSRPVDPTEGELRRIKAESRRRSAGRRTIDEALARRVAAGELTVAEALDEHRCNDGTPE